MSYISTHRTGNEVLVWERVNGERRVATYTAPWYFYTTTKDANPKYYSMFGEPLERHDFGDSREFNIARAQVKGDRGLLFESDIPPDLKILAEHYYDVPAPKLNTTMYDIEVDYDPQVGFASVQDPYAPINSVALHHEWLNKIVVLAVPPNYAPKNPTNDSYQMGYAPKEFIDELNQIAPLPKGLELVVYFCRNEKELLDRYLREIADSDVVCGWNSDFFDAPYVTKRTEKYGKKYTRRLSFDLAPPPVFRDVEVMGRTSQTVDYGGRISADYMVLFRKYEMAERPSYKLESIAAEMLPDLPKLEYEGSLATLYRTNFPWFVRYNIRDTEILDGLEKRLGYVDLANQMMHLSTGTFKHVTGTLKLAELATINFCHKELNNVIVPDLDPPESSSSIQGAFVLIPQVGMHENIGSIDLNSLYPSAIRSLNISPETLIGQFIDDIKAHDEIAIGSDIELTLVFNDRVVSKELKGQAISLPAKKWREELQKMQWAVSGYGTVFSQANKGIIPTILEGWYATRKKYQALKKQATSDGDKIKATYYDKLQYVYKIKLNSFYGALTNAYFRFYDLRMGESTTSCGRKILLHQCAQTCAALDGVYQRPDIHTIDEEEQESYGYSKNWSVVYGDTDSTYFVTHAENTKDAIIIADEVSRLVNESFPDFMRNTFLCQPGFDELMKCGREIVSDRGIFVQKKRYILHIVDNEGQKVDKLKVMGLDTKKTTLPKEVSSTLNGFIGDLLRGSTWDDVAKRIVDYQDYIATTTDIMAIGLPKGVKKVEYYTGEYEADEKARIPGHVAASMFYNECLKQFEDKESMPITSGMKIKVFYLTQKYGKFKSIAIPVDIEVVPAWFLNNFTVNRQMHIDRLVINPLQNILKAIQKVVPTKQSMFVENAFEF